MEVINVSECPPQWQWVKNSVSDEHSALPWIHSSIRDRSLPGWVPKRYAMSRIAAAHEAVARHATPDSVIVTHGPRLAFYAQLAMAVRRRRVHHLAYTFSFTDLPTGLEHRAMRRWLKSVDRFVCFSGMERQLYADHFDLDVGRFESQYWAGDVPEVEAGGPVVAGEYVCALGVQARDYATLIDAVRGLPTIRMVLVAWPSALAGITLPSNVEVYSGIPLARAMNILAHSRFTVLPLRGSRVPCGHSTIVPAMQLGKAVIATQSAGVGEYVFPYRNGLTVPPGDVLAMRTAIDELYADPTLAQQLGRYGQQFADIHCTERTVGEWFSRYVRRSFPTRAGSDSPARAGVAATTGAEGPA